MILTLKPTLKQLLWNSFFLSQKAGSIYMLCKRAGINPYLTPDKMWEVLTEKVNKESEEQLPPPEEKVQPPVEWVDWPKFSEWKPNYLLADVLGSAGVAPYFRTAYQFYKNGGDEVTPSSRKSQYSREVYEGFLARRLDPENGLDSVFLDLSEKELHLWLHIAGRYNPWAAMQNRLKEVRMDTE